MRAGSASLLLLGLLLGGGCILPFEAEGRFCGGPDDCESGYQCVAEVCVSQCESDGDCPVEGDICAAGVCLSPERNRNPAVLTSLPACDEVYPSDEEPDEQSVILGSLLPLTGTNAEKGLARREAVYLATDEINDRGGLDGRTLFILSCDTGSEVEPAVEAASFMAGFAALPATLGTAASEITIRSFNDAARDRGMLMMSPSATSPAITGQSDLLWRTAPSDATQGIAIGALLRDRNYQQVVLVHVQDAYGEGLRDAVRTAFCDEGDTDRCLNNDLFTARSFPVSPSDDDIDAAVAAVLDEAPDAVVLVGQIDETVRFLQDAITTDLEDVPFVLPDSARNDRLAEVQSDLFKSNVIGTAPATPDDATFGAFESAYESRTSVRPAPTFTPNAYDALYLLAYATGAIPEGEEITGAAIRDNLRRLSSGPSVEVGPTSFVSTLRDLREDPQATIDFDGASGPLDFPPGETEAAADVSAWYFDLAEDGVRDFPGVIYDSATGTYSPPPTN